MSRFLSLVIDNSMFLITIAIFMTIPYYILFIHLIKNNLLTPNISALPVEIPYNPMKLLHYDDLNLSPVIKEL